MQFLRDCPDVYVGDAAECERFVEGVLWMDRSGASEYGNWNTTYKRFARWCDRGVWERPTRADQYGTGPGVSGYRQYGGSSVRPRRMRWGSPGKKGGNQRKPWAEVAAGSARRFT